uniref:Elongation factor EFG domain-containing protein n=1 Tax=Oryza rufipogon TaxID=4529 RepID=A0A0E0PNQ4_ORYRU
MTLALGKGRYFALGRVFSGKVTSGMNVQFLSPSYDQLIKKNSTLTSVKVMPMRAPAVAVRVDCKAYPDLPKFLEALKKLANTSVKTRLNDIPLSELEGCGRYPPFQEMKDMLWRTGGCRTEHVAGRATERPLTASSYWYAG